MDNDSPEASSTARAGASNAWRTSAPRRPAWTVSRPANARPAPGAETGSARLDKLGPVVVPAPERFRGGRYDRCVEAPEIPKWNQMFRPTIEALRTLGGSGTIQEINEKAIELEGYTDEQLAVLHGDGEKSEIEYRLAWARTNLKNLGALTNSSRGVWALTEYGREVTEVELIEGDKEWRKQLAANRAQKLIDQPATVPGEEQEVGLDAGEGWKVHLLRCLMEMPPGAFERLSQRVLREAGFVNVRVTGRPGDGGIDGTGIYRLSPLVSFPTLSMQAILRQCVSRPCA